MSADESPAIGEATPAEARDRISVNFDHLREVLVELCEKAHPEAQDEEGGVGEMVGDYIAALRARPASASPVDGATPETACVHNRSKTSTVTPDVVECWDCGKTAPNVVELIAAASPVETEATPADDISQLETLAAKCEQETQVYLGHRNAERAAAIRRVLAKLSASESSARSLREALAAAQRELDIASKDYRADVNRWCNDEQGAMVCSQLHYDELCAKLAASESSARSLREEREALQKENARLLESLAAMFPGSQWDDAYAKLRAASLSPSPAS